MEAQRHDQWQRRRRRDEQMQQKEDALEQSRELQRPLSVLVGVLDRQACSSQSHKEKRPDDSAAGEQVEQEQRLLHLLERLEQKSPSATSNGAARGLAEGDFGPRPVLTPHKRARASYLRTPHPIAHRLISTLLRQDLRDLRNFGVLTPSLHDKAAQLIQQGARVASENATLQLETESQEAT